METTSKHSRNLINTICKALAVAMGIAVVVLTILGTANTTTSLTLLGFGLAALAVASFD